MRFYKGGLLVLSG